MDAAIDVFIPEDYVRSRYRRRSSRVESPYSTGHKNQSPAHHNLNHNGDSASNSSAASCTSTISDSRSGGGSSTVEIIILNCLTP